jgi:predicted acyltransferase
MDAAAGTPDRGRLLALDVFRGLAVIGMMLVDWPGNWDTRFALFEHSPWLGVTAADFIFPSFMFIMGVAIPFSLLARRDAGTKPLKLYGDILRRAVALFALGTFLNICWYSSPTVWPIDWSRMRVLGVLQRFALVYPIVAIASLHLSVRKMALLGVGILLAYWVIMTRVPVPGFGAPDLARLPQGEVAPNLATWMDKTFLGLKADSYPYDSEGILSNLPAIATTLIGALAGFWLRRKEVPAAERVNGLFGWGVTLVMAGYLWGLGFPLCKKLWTSSFVLFMGGWSLLFLGALMWLIDLKGKTGTLLALPRWYGSNALAGIVMFTFIDNVMSRLPVGHKSDHTVYALKEYLYDHLFRSFLSDRTASWVYSVVAILALSLLFRSFHTRKWFFRV